VNEAFLLQAVDSNRVDVAPGSNVVGEDNQIRRHDILSHFHSRVASIRL
jgi:hypothetical protein